MESHSNFSTNPTNNISFGSVRLKKTDYNNLESVASRLATIVLIILGVISIFTNAVLAYILLKRKYVKITKGRILYANISIGNELFFGAIAYTFHSYWALDLAIYISLISAYVTSSTLAYLSYKRYQAVTRAIHRFQIVSGRSDRKSKREVVFVIILIWILSVLLALIVGRFKGFEYPAKFEDFEDQHFATSCFLMSARLEAFTQNSYFLPSWSILGSLLFGILFSGRTLCILHNWRKYGQNRNGLRVSHKRKSTIIIMILVLSLLCWTPVVVFVIFEGVTSMNGERKICDYHYLVFAIIVLILALDALISPIVHWCLDPEIRNAVNLILRRHQPQPIKCNTTMSYN